MNGIIECCGELPVINKCLCAGGTFCGCYESISCSICNRKINGIREKDIKDWNEGKQDIFPNGGGISIRS